MCYTFKNIKFYKLILLLTNEPFTQIYERLTWNLSAEGKKMLFKDRRKKMKEEQNADGGFISSLFCLVRKHNA